MPVKELPVLITPTIASDPGRMAKAVMRNFDHLIGEAGHTQNIIEAGPDVAVLEETIETLGGDTSSLEQKLNDAGVGSPDGAAPTVAPTGLSVTPGINYDLWITWVPVKNNSPVTYKIERKVGAGGAWTEVATTVVVPGQDKGHWHHHDTGLLMNTDYYYQVRASDDDGDGPYSAITGPHQVNKTVNEQIADATINIATKVTGLLPQANLSTITDASKLADAIISTQATFDRIVSGAVIAGQHIVGGTIVSSKLYSGAVTADRIQANNIAAGAITAEKISVTSLSAINANMGNIVAGTLTSVDIYSSNLYSGYIEGGTIQGAIYRTAAPGNDRISIRTDSAVGGALPDETIAWISSGNSRKGTISMISSDMYIEPNGTLKLRGGSGEGVNISADVSIWKDTYIINGKRLSVDGAIDAGGRVSGNRIEAGGSTVNPPAGYTAIYTVGNELRARNSSGTVRTLCTF